MLCVIICFAAVFLERRTPQDSCSLMDCLQKFAGAEAIMEEDTRLEWSAGSSKIFEYCIGMPLNRETPVFGRSHPHDPYRARSSS